MRNTFEEMANLELFDDLALIEERVKTFQKKWPYPKGSCSPLEMAKAGFFMEKVGVMVTIKCYYCFKELEGWEPEDIPMEEHRKHASYCPYVQRFEEAPEELTVEDVVVLELGKLKRKEVSASAWLATLQQEVESITKPPEQKKIGRPLKKRKPST